MKRRDMDSYNLKLGIDLRTVKGDAIGIFVNEIERRPELLPTAVRR